MRTKKILAASMAAPVLFGAAASAPAAATDQASAAVVGAKDTKRAQAAARSSRAMGAVAMRSKGTRFSPARAANRLENWADAGVSGYHNQCLRLADNAYQPKGNRTGTALQQWYRAKKHGYGHPGDRRPPVGAQMFWRTSNPAGHIATYVGNGKAVTNMPGGQVKEIDWHRMNKWGPYLGWAEPYYG